MSTRWFSRPAPGGGRARLAVGSDRARRAVGGALARLALAGAVLGCLSLAGGPLRAGGTPGWRAGEPAELPVTIPVAEAQSTASSASALARRLGLPGLALPAVRAFDRTIGRAIDTIELRDADGRASALVAQEAGSGRLRSAVRLAWSPDLDRARVDAAGAPAAARRAAALAGVSLPAATPATTWDDGMDAWQVRWNRFVDGIPVAADGVVAWIHRGGQLKALSVFESSLAAAPVTRIPAPAALDAARAYIQRNGIDRLAGLVLEAPALAWAEANDFVDPALPDAPAAERRLAWVVRFSYLPPGWMERHVVELYVDAGTGQLIGGAETA